MPEPTGQEAAGTQPPAGEEAPKPNQEGEGQHLEEKPKEGDNDHKSLLAQKEHFRSKYESEKAVREQLEADRKAAEEKQLAENQEWQTLAEKREQELVALRQQSQTVALKNAFIVKISEHNPVNIDDAFALANLAEVKVAEDGTVEGIDEAIKTLVEAKPFLFGGSGSKSVNAEAGAQGKDAAEGASKRVWKASEVKGMPIEEYAKHSKEIRVAQRDGRYLENE